MSKDQIVGKDRPLCVAVVDDDRVTREGLRLIINSTPGYRCEHVFDSVEAGVVGLGSDPPDVLLLDVRLPGMDGSQGVRLFRERYPDLKVLMLTNYAEDDTVFESICNGACGYLLKKTPPAKLLDAVSEAACGGAPMSPQIAARVLEVFRKSKPASKVGHNLTPHEVRLLGLLSEGHSYQRVADGLSVTINTIRHHIRSIYEKLHVHSKSEAVSKALKHGIL
ncbi:MAG: response regulator transcription factor [Acidobacteriota bacterium]